MLADVSCLLCKELAGANTQLRDQAAAAAAANANLDFLRERCARLEAQLAEAQAAEEPHQHHPGMLVLRMAKGFFHEPTVLRLWAMLGGVCVLSFRVLIEALITLMIGPAAMTAKHLTSVCHNAAVDVYLPNQDPENQPAMDVPVEAPGTPVASSARGLDGLSDITVPAKAAMLEARVAELEVILHHFCNVARLKA